MWHKNTARLMQSFQPSTVSLLRYHRRFRSPSLHVLECSFHVGHNQVMANVSMTRGAHFELLALSLDKDYASTSQFQE